MMAGKAKKSNRPKVRAYVFSVDGDIRLVVVARSKEEADERFKEEGGPDGIVAHVGAVRFAY